MKLSPGSILRSKMEPTCKTVTSVAMIGGIKPDIVRSLLNGYRTVTPDIASGLALVFPDTTPEYWLDLQKQYDDDFS